MGSNYDKAKLQDLRDSGGSLGKYANVPAGEPRADHASPDTGCPTRRQSGPGAAEAKAAMKKIGKRFALRLVQRADAVYAGLPDPFPEDGRFDAVDVAVADAIVRQTLLWTEPRSPFRR